MASRPRVIAKRVPTAPISTSLRTRSGRETAYARAFAPPNEFPTRSAWNLGFVGFYVAPARGERA